MGQTSQPLLAFMNEKFGPVDEARVDLLQGFAVILTQLDLFPQLRGHVLPFDGFHVEVDGAAFGIAADGGIAGVGQGAGLAVAKAGDVILIAAEILQFGRSVRGADVSYGHWYEGEGAYFSLKEQNC